MKAMILAAGKGIRMRPLTEHLPKPMLPFFGAPILEHIITHLGQCDVSQVLINTCAQSELVKQHFLNGHHLGVNIRYSDELEIIQQLRVKGLGTAGGLKFAFHHSEFIDQSLVVVCGDALFDLDVRNLMAFHRSRKAVATIALTPARLHPTHLYGVVHIDPQQRILSFEEKPHSVELQDAYINTGIYIFEPEALDLIPNGTEFDIGNDLFPLLLSNKVPLYGYTAPYQWLDVGDINQYWQAIDEVLTSNQYNFTIPGEIICERQHISIDCIKDLNNFTSEGPVYIDQNCTIEKGVHFKGPVYIGNHTHIGKGAHITNSIITRDTHINRGAFIEGALIHDGHLILSKRRTNFHYTSRMPKLIQKNS